MRVVVVAGVLALLTCPGGTAAAQEGSPRGPGLITTHATARGRIANTVADLSVGVQVHAPTAAAAQAGLASGSDRLMRYLRGEGVERLRTDALSVLPQVVAEDGRAARVVGYDGSVRASFRVPAERAGAVAAGALGNGGNEVEGVSLQPREAELDAERSRLAAEAAADALRQAKAVAAATGRGLGAVWRIDVDPQAVAPGRPLMRAAVAAPATAPATAAGEAEVSATVTVTAALVEP